MTIDVQNESLLTFAALAEALPKRRAGRPVNISTIYRWREVGLRGVRLEAIRVGGGWCTSWEAFTRFCEELTQQEGEQTSSKNFAPKLHQDRLDHADQLLDEEQW